MKKLIAIMLCSVMSVSLVGCSTFFETITDSASEEDVRGKQISNKESEEDTVKENDTEETETENNETETNEKAFSIGKTDGLVYENEFIGIGCNLESDWRFYSDEEIKELNNISLELAGEDFEKMMEEAEVIYDMYAVSDNEMDNIVVNLEKANKLLINQLNLRDNLEDTIPMIESGLGNMGYTNLETNLDTITIEGKELDCLCVSGEINGLKLYQKTFPIKCNGYLANVTVTTYDENNIDSIIEKFYFVD